MEGYLLDTNAVGHWYDENDKLTSRINALDPRCMIWVSAITLGEIEFGHNIHLGERDLAKRDEFERWVLRSFPRERVFDVDRQTRSTYGLIRARIFEEFPPNPATDNHPEKCYDRVTATSLGIDENDLWIVAQAIQHGVTLITQDKMERIKSVAERACGFKFDFADWTL